MPRVLLLLPTATYRAADFLAAADRLGVDIVVASERRQALAEVMGDRAVVVPMGSVDAGTRAIVALHARRPLDAVVAVDDQGVAVAAQAAAALGLAHNPPAAVGLTRDKGAMRHRLAAHGVPQPAYRLVPPGGAVGRAASEIGYPCVVKPVSRSASQGVIRIDGADDAHRAERRIRSMLGPCDEPLLVESFVAGSEVAVEALLADGHLQVLAVFDKPDAPQGPFFEETIYVTPPSLPSSVLQAIETTVAQAAAALGLIEGPVHAELRIGAGHQLLVLELAARSIGGLCARSLIFGSGVSLEELILTQALGWGAAALTREPRASGVLMLPIAASGVLDEVIGRERALAVEGVDGVEITVAPGRPLVPLPEGDRYLGFVFAHGANPEQVAESLRLAQACLEVRLR